MEGVRMKNRGPRSADDVRAYIAKRGGLTERHVRKLPVLEDDYVVGDKGPDGVRSLYVKVYAATGKRWFRYGNRRPGSDYYETLGLVGEMTLQRARTEAQRINQGVDIAEGRDPHRTRPKTNRR
jgi:hypothetical protein